MAKGHTSKPAELSCEYPAPWEVGTNGAGRTYIQAANGRWPIQSGCGFDESDPAAFALIVSCVNYCAGMEAYDLVAGGGLQALAIVGNERRISDELNRCREQLLQHATEWLCRTCNTVQPAPKTFDFRCQKGCNDTLRPSSVSLRIVESERDKAINQCDKALEDFEQAMHRVSQLERRCERLLAALKEAATSLSTISIQAGKDECMPDHHEVRGYARNRALVANEAIAEVDPSPGDDGYCRCLNGNPIVSTEETDCPKCGGKTLPF